MLGIICLSIILPLIPATPVLTTALTARLMELAVWSVQAAQLAVSELYLQAEPAIAILVTLMTTAR